MRELKFKIYPTAGQIEQIQFNCDCYHFVYNRFRSGLRHWSKNYESPIFRYGDCQVAYVFGI